MGHPRKGQLWRGVTACRLGAATARRPLRRGERGERREEKERMLDRHPEVIKQPNETHCMLSKRNYAILACRMLLTTPFYPQIKIKGIQIKIRGLQIKITRHEIKIR